MVGSLSGSTHFLHNGNSASSQDHHAMKKRKTSSDNCIGEIIFVWDRRDKMYAFTTSNLVDDIRCPFIFRFQFPPGLSACLSILCLSGTPQQLYILMMSALECIPSWQLFFLPLMFSTEIFDTYHVKNPPLWFSTLLFHGPVSCVLLPVICFSYFTIVSLLCFIGRFIKEVMCNQTILNHLSSLSHWSYQSRIKLNHKGELVCY